MILIGLCARTGPGSGKSEVAKYLWEQLQGGVRVSFASKLKHLTQNCYGILTGDYLPEDKNAKLQPDFTVRDLFIGFGELFRKVHPNIWVDKVMQLAESIRVPGRLSPIILIDDVRYANEADEILKRGGHLFCIERDGHNAEDTGDVFEHYQFAPESTIYNNGESLELLHQEVDSKIVRLLGEQYGQILRGQGTQSQPEGESG